MNGVWVTGQDVFLSPGDSKMMYRKSATLSFLFEQVVIIRMIIYYYYFFLFCLGYYRLLQKEES